MATSLGINSSSYAGEAAAGYIDAAVLSADSLEKGYVTVHENVKHKLALRVLSNTGGLIDAYACDFSNADDLDLNEAVITPTELMVNVEVCKQQFAHSWEAAQTGAGFSDADIPKDFADFMLLHIAGEVAESIEYNLWQGNYDEDGTSPTYTSFNGICQLIEASGSTVKVDTLDKTDGSTQITSFAVSEDATYNMQRGVENLPAALKGRYDKVKIFVSPGTFAAYRDDMSSKGFGNEFHMSDAKFQFNGYEIIVASGMADATIILGEIKNLHFGTDLLSDFNEAKVIDMSETTGDDNVRVRMQFKGGCQITNDADLVMVYPDAA